MNFLLRKSPSICKFMSSSLFQQQRHLNLQENISQTLLNEYGVITPRFGVAKCAKGAEKIARDLLTKNLMVKAQVMTGGRGLGKFKNGFKSGIHSATSPDEVKDLAEKMIGQHLVTKQSGPEGKICNSVMVAERKFPRREFYFAIALDRELGPVCIASRYGGVNIEEVAADNPDSIIYEPIDQIKGLTCEMAEWIARRVGIIDQSAPTVKMLCNLYDLFIQKEALLVEINPYTEDVCLNYFALDAKMSFDESARFRQPEIFSLYDPTQDDPKEVAANHLGMNYIALDGNIGCMVNGAGLAMATMDILKLHGGTPANFLDDGGMATADGIKEAVKVILMDEKVRTVFVNIFGGIMRCDYIVEGLLKAIKECDIKIPIVVRLQGNMHAEGIKMIRETNINIIEREDFEAAAATAVICSEIIHLADCSDLEAALKMQIKAEYKPVSSTKLKHPPCPADKPSQGSIKK